MYIRVSILEFDPACSAEVERLWLEDSRPSALAQRGNCGAHAFRIVGSPGQMMMVGHWESLEQAEAYLHGPEHDMLMAKYAPYMKGGISRYVGELIG